MLLRLIALLALGLTIILCALGGGFAGWGWIWMIPLGFVGSFLLLALLSVLFLWAITLPIDQNKPQDEDSPFYRNLSKWYIEALVQLLQVRIHAEGLDLVPNQGRFFLVCNHNFIADPGILLHCLPESQLAFISKKENRNLFVVGRIMHAMLCQCIDRENDRAALKTILECIRLTKEDRCSIGVFPEGGTHSDNLLHPLRPGVFKIPQKCKVPIVVCTLTGTREILKNGLHLKPTDVTLHVVTVLSPQELAGKKTTEISQLVYEAMAQDLGPQAIAKND